MKRHPDLRELSEDHHHGLVLARKAKTTGCEAADGSVIDVWAEVELRFNAELAPHFVIEETLIAPFLEIAGASELATRLYEEHRALRECVRPGGGRTSADLRRFGDLLEEHIRFEERELFEAAQRLLSPERLGAIAEACRANRT